MDESKTRSGMVKTGESPFYRQFITLFEGYVERIRSGDNTLAFLSEDVAEREMLFYIGLSQCIEDIFWCRDKAPDERQIYVGAKRFPRDLRDLIQEMMGFDTETVQDEEPFVFSYMTQVLISSHIERRLRELNFLEHIAEQRGRGESEKYSYEIGVVREVAGEKGYK